jgi:type I restriction enzyme S subunit
MRKLVKLGAIAHISSGGTPSRTDQNYWNGNIPWVKTAQIQNCVITIDDVDEWITEEGLKNSSAKMVPAGTIVLGMIGQGKTRGQVGHLSFNACTNQNAATIICSKECNNWFIFQYLLFSYKKIRALSNSSGQGNLNLKLVRIIPILLPTLFQQGRIAKMLCVWDNAIEKTEALIAAKEKQFEWLLRTVITKPTEDGNWKSEKLTVLLKIKKGQQLNRTALTKIGKYPAWNGGVSPSGYTEKFNTNKNTITVSEGGNSCGFVNYCREPFWCGGHCYSLLEISDKIIPEFLYYYLKSYEKNIMRLRVGSGLPNIQKKDIDNFIINYPEKIMQEKVIQILNTAQQEINLDKTILARYQLQKRGLMQKLLTGEWQVRSNSSPANEIPKEINA